MIDWKAPQLLNGASAMNLQDLNKQYQLGRYQLGFATQLGALAGYNGGNLFDFSNENVIIPTTSAGDSSSVGSSLA